MQFDIDDLLGTGNEVLVCHCLICIPGRPGCSTARPSLPLPFLPLPFSTSFLFSPSLPLLVLSLKIEFRGLHVLVFLQ